MATVSETNTETTLQLYANPLMIQDKQLSLFEDHVFGGKSVLDGNNVFTFGLEMGATLTAGIVNEMINNFQSLYPARAQTMSDLYRHLSDYDYVDMFSTPSTTTIELMFERDFLIDHAPKDEDEDGSFKVEIPEFSTFTIGEHKFGIHYPINIKIRKAYKADGYSVDYDKCIFHCAWNTDVVNPLYKLTTNILEHRMYKREGINLLCISIPIQQFVISIKKEDTIPSTGFIKRYQYSDRFYAIRVFHYWNNQWVEIAETLSDVIYNPQVITAKVKVLSDIHTIEVSIPQVYFTHGMIGNRLMCMIYTTEGEVDIDIRNYTNDQFDASFLIDDTVIDDRYSAFLKRIPMLQIIPLSSRISGGSNGKTFEEMKNRVMNSVGGDDLLVTPKQLEAHLVDTGFKVSNYIDNITDRIYLASKTITDSNKNIVGSGEYMTTIDSTILSKAGKEYDTIIDFKDKTSYMILPTSIFRYDTDTDSMIPLSKYERKKLLDDNTTEKMISELNSGIYTFTPFHIKLTTSSKLPMAGAFDLMKPTVSNVSFVGENKHTSSQMAMYGSVILHLNKGSGGYQLTVALYKTDDLAKIDMFDKHGHLNFAVILRTRSSEGIPIYLKGNYIGKNDKKLDLIQFNITTGYKITEKDTIDTDVFTVISDVVSHPSTNYLSLNQSYELLFFASNTLIIDQNAITESRLQSNIPNDSDLNSMVWLATQKFDIKLGESISSLRSNVFLTLTGKEYKTYDTTEFATYATDVYERYPDDVINESTGLIIHHKGELKFENGKLSIKKYAGDLIVSSTDDSFGLRNPSFVINRTSSDSFGNKTNTQECLYSDTEHRSALAEPSNIWYPFRVFKDSDGKWKAIYTGLKDSATIVEVKDLMKCAIDTIKPGPNNSYNPELILEKSSDRFRSTENHTLKDPIKGNFIYVVDDTENASESQYFIYCKIDSTTQIKTYVIESHERENSNGYESRKDVEGFIGPSYGALYMRDPSYSEFDYTSYMTEEELCEVLDMLNNNESDDYIINRSNIDSNTLGKIKKFRDPWIKLIETNSYDSETDTGGFADIANYWGTRSYMNFNSDLTIKTHDDRVSVSGLKALAYLQERAVNQSTIKHYEIMNEGVIAANTDPDQEYRLVWVDSYNSENDNTSKTAKPLIADITINDQKEDEHKGALLFGTHDDSGKHYVVVTGPSFIECYNRLMSCPTMSGCVYEATTYYSNFNNLPIYETSSETDVESIKLLGRETPLKENTEDLIYQSAKDRIINNYTSKSTMTAIVSNELNFVNSIWRNKWPWEMNNWVLPDGSSITSNGISMRLDRSNTDVKILHTIDDVILDELGKPAENDGDLRKIIYHIDAIHCDYKLIESDQHEFATYKEDVQELLRHYFDVLEDTRPLLLERTNLYYTPIKSMGYGKFKGANGETVLFPLEIEVSLRLHIPVTVGGSDTTKELIRSNVIRIIEDHISSGNISCTILANQIRNSMSDSILYVDVLGINGNTNIQTLVSADPNQSSVRLKQLLVLNDDNTISVEKGVNIEWSIMQ